MSENPETDISSNEIKEIPLLYICIRNRNLIIRRPGVPHHNCTVHMHSFHLGFLKLNRKFKNDWIKKKCYAEVTRFLNIPCMCIWWLKLGDIIQNDMGRSVHHFKNTVRTIKLWNRKTTLKQYLHLILLQR